MLKALIIDDEQAIRELLVEIIQQNFADSITVSGTGNSVAEAVKLIHQHKPDVVFLDIEMPGNSGLQLVDFFNPEEMCFEIVFITAYSEYAIKAFKVSAFDYLLKPIDMEELSSTIERLKQSIKIRENIAPRVSILKEQYQKELTSKNMAIRTLEGTHFIETEKIIYLEADGMYTNIYLQDNRKIMASKPIGDFEEMMDMKRTFFRAHRSYIINMKKIIRYSKTEGYTIHIENGVEIPLSRYRKEEFEEKIKQEN